MKEPSGDGGAGIGEGGSASGRPVILFVDDEPSVRRTGSRVLERLGYTVQLAEDGVDALAQLDAAPARFALVVTDMVMPRMDARGLIRAIRGRWPALPVILSTGYDMGRLTADEVGLFDRLVPKPYTPEELGLAVRQTLAAAPPTSS